MSAISEFATKQNAFIDRIDKAVDGLKDDYKYFTETIQALQNNPGPITPADQTLLDGLETRVTASLLKLEALDGLQPPTPPAEQ